MTPLPRVLKQEMPGYEAAFVLRNRYRGNVNILRRYLHLYFKLWPWLLAYCLKWTHTTQLTSPISATWQYAGWILHMNLHSYSPSHQRVFCGLVVTNWSAKCECVKFDFPWHSYFLYLFSFHRSVTNYKRCYLGLKSEPNLNPNQQGVRAVFKSETTLRCQLVRPKDAADPAKQDGVVYRIPCECGKVYIGETGRPMQDRIKEHDRDIRLARTETSAVSEHAHNTGHKPLWNEVKFIDRDPYYYTRRVKEAIHIRLHPGNINRDSGIEIPEA